MAHVSDIKLIRTDTTLDLSQKAEKGMLIQGNVTPFYSQALPSIFRNSPMWDNLNSSSLRVPMVSLILYHYTLKLIMQRIFNILKGDPSDFLIFIFILKRLLTKHKLFIIDEDNNVYIEV